MSDYVKAVTRWRQFQCVRDVPERAVRELFAGSRPAEHGYFKYRDRWHHPCLWSSTGDGTGDELEWRRMTRPDPESTIQLYLRVDGPCLPGVDRWRCSCATWRPLLARCPYDGLRYQIGAF